VAAIPARLRTIEPLVSGPVEPTRTVKLGFGVTLRGGLDFRVNGETHRHDASVRVGELVPAFRSWEDVVNVPPKATVRIAWMPDDRPGRWMYHCHILEHHAAGMIGRCEVV
jgi:FtsP/CotA-like multicopper oxidase with cupredoxin domain